MQSIQPLKKVAFADLYVLTLLVIVLLTNCTPSKLSEQELQGYVQDESNGLTKIVERKGIELSVNYKPTDLLVSQELRNRKREQTLIDSLRNKYSQYSYFVLNISKDGKEILNQSQNFDAFSQNLQNLSFRMKEYVHLTTAQQDTVPVLDFVYPRLYGMGGSTSLLFVFDQEKIEDTDWVQFNLKDIGLGIGKSHFRFETSDIENAPQIDFK